MIFSSAAFLVFFVAVIVVHWFVIPHLVPKHRQLSVLHGFLLACSYFFYMSWDWRFGFLMAASTVIDYSAGLWMESLHRRSAEHDARTRRLLQLGLWLSICVNLGILGYFKYSDFFIGSFVDLANSIAPDTYTGTERDSLLLKVILPLGISFFTFQSMSYTIDVYRKVIGAERNFIRFALYVSFFPQLVAGPIVVAKEFLPQLQKMPTFDAERMRIAARWFALGFFKKVVLADNMAPVVDAIYGSPASYGTEGHWIGAVGFWIQVYGDFSGYSDMAWGTAIFMGYRLPENFRMPYISRSVTEHWRRWHISLIRWIRDYLYVPLGGSRGGYWQHKRNVFLTMFLAGVWHGANWTFVVWGAIHGTILTIESAVRQWLAPDEKSPAAQTNQTPTGPLARLRFRAIATGQILLTSFCTIYFGTMFRSQNISDSWLILKRMLFVDTIPDTLIRSAMYKPVALGALAIIVGHWLGYLIFEKGKQLRVPAWLELSAAPAVMLLFVQIGASGVSPFIYFVF